MDDRTARLESTVEQLQNAVLGLQRRIEALEQGLTAAEPAAEAVAPAAVEPESAAGPVSLDPIAILSLIGRLLLILAGGFFLRAMTESGALTTPIGLAIGFVYGLAWLVLADRVGARRDALGAVFYAVATALVAFPLLVEATLRFRVLGSPAAALGILVPTAALTWVAWRRELRIVAWIAVAGAIGTSLVLMVKTGAVAPFALVLIALGLATIWIGHALGWSGLRWPAAFAADVAVVGATLRVLAPHQPDPPQVAIALQLLLLGSYLVSIAVRTLLRGRNVTPFDVVQTLLALLVGFGGALYLTRVTGISPATLGTVGLVLGIVCYGVAVVFMNREGGERNTYFYTSLALVLVLVGTGIVLAAPWYGMALALLAVAAVAGWFRSGRLFMLLHAAGYLVAAGVASGALAYCARLLAALVAGPWAWPAPGVAVVWAAAALCVWLASAPRKAGPWQVVSGARVVLLLVLLAASGACVIGYLAPLAGRLADGSVDRGVLATVTTAVLALATLLLAWLGRRERFREWAWMVYPLLVGTGLKLVAQDFKYSRPATLFIALALYGAALIVAPRLRRDGARDATPQPDTPAQPG